MFKLWNALTTLGRIAVTAMALAIFCGVVWFIFVRPGQLKEDAVKAKAETAYSGATAKSTKDAQDTAMAQALIEGARARETEEANDEIRATPGAAVPVDRDTNLAGLRALCMRHDRRDSAQCKSLLRAAP